MINWRKIADVGNPTEDKTYLVTDGTEISTSDIKISILFKGDGNPIKTFKGWDGDLNTYEDNGCCAGTRMFNMTPTHWCPTDELNLPSDTEKKVFSTEDVKKAIDIARTGYGRDGNINVIDHLTEGSLDNYDMEFQFKDENEIITMLDN